MGVPPWELEKVDSEWYRQALARMNAKRIAEKEAYEAATNKGGD